MPKLATLKPKQELFKALVLEGKTAIEAYRGAGYLKTGGSDKDLAQRAYSVLSSVSMQAALTKEVDKIDKQRMIQDLRTIGQIEEKFSLVWDKAWNDGEKPDLPNGLRALEDLTKIKGGFKESIGLHLEQPREYTEAEIADVKLAAKAIVSRQIEGKAE